MDTILTDIDDAILNFSDGFQNWVEAKGFKTFGRLRNLPSVGELLRCSRSEADRLVIEYSVSEHFSMLSPETCALRVLPLLNTMGYDFVGITACVNEPVVHEYRLHNIANAFGFDFSEIKYVGLLGGKRDVLSKYDPSYWVEDNAINASDGAEVGHRSFLLNRSANLDADIDHRVTRVDDWNEIYKIIISDG